MRPLLSVAAALPAGLASLLLIGCAARPSVPPATHEAIAQQAQARQKTLDRTEEPSDRMVNLTAADHERLGDQYVYQGNPTLAFAQYNRSLRRDPRQSRVRDKLGLLYAQRGLWQEAEDEFRRILRDDVTYAPAYEGLGQVQLSRGRVSEAEDSFWRTVQLNPRLWKSHAFLGLLYASRGNHAEAAAEFQAALALKPAHQALTNNLGRAYYAMGRYDDAIEQFQQALRATPSDPQLSNNLGLALAKAGRYQEALDMFRNGGGLQKAYNNLGVVYWAAKDHNEAIACFQRALEVDSGYELPTRNLAAVRADQPAQPNPAVRSTPLPCSPARGVTAGTAASP